MALRKIVIYGNPVLRMKVSEITEFDDSLQFLAGDMIETMQEAEGIGLAAPQIGESLALCVVNCELIEEGNEPKAFVNPVIYDSDGEAMREEGCLSIPDISEEITRAETIKIRYQDLKGNEHDEECECMLARVLQHEVDHMNGVLFIDRISPMRRKLLSKKLKQIASGN